MVTGLAHQSKPEARILAAVVLARSIGEQFLAQLEREAGVIEH